MCVFFVLIKDLGHKQYILSFTRTCLAVLLFLFLFSSSGLNLTFVCLMWLLKDHLCESCVKNKEIKKINNPTKSTKWKCAKMKQIFKATSKILRNVEGFLRKSSSLLVHSHKTHGVHMNYDQIMMSSTHSGGPQVNLTYQLRLPLLKHVMYTSDSHLAK